jgi:Na+/melibiose symporter-like transporter
VGTVLAIVLANYVFLRPHNGEPGQFYKAGYAPLALTVGIVMFASIIVSSLGTHHQIAGLRVQDKRQVPFSQVLGEIWLTVSNRNFVVLASAGMIFGITVGLSGGLTPYFNTYLWGLGTEQIGAIQLSALISALPAVILAPILARRFGKKRVCITLFFIAILTLAVPISGKLLGLTPPSGSTALVFFLAANHMLVSGLSMMGFIIVTSMIADIVEETELRTGRRSEGLIFAADTFLQKVSTGVATFLPGLMVTYVGLPVHARPKTLDPLDHLHLLLSHRPGPA